MVLFDRSWYNRAGVERVMGFCTEDEVWEFFRTCPEFERMLIRSGIILLKYWFSVSDEEQEKRFQARLKDPLKVWKLSPMDLESRLRWVEYSQAKDEMFSYTDTKDSPWWVVNADDKTPRAAQHDPPPARPDPLRGRDATRTSSSPSGRRTRATCGRRSTARRSSPSCTDAGYRRRPAAGSPSGP